MRKLKLQVQLTADGFMAGPNGEMDFMMMAWSDDLNQYIGAITDRIDCVLLGRKLAEGFIPYWASVAEDESNPEQSAGKKFTGVRKVVFSKTLEQVEGPATELARGSLAEEVGRLKKEETGGDLMAYGGAGFVSSLIREGLVDEFILLVSPVLLGEGLRFSQGLGGRQDLQLVSSKSFDCGMVVLEYVRKAG